MLAACGFALWHPAIWLIPFNAAVALAAFGAWGIAEREIKRIKGGRFVLLPASEQTHGHGTHTWAAVWQQYLAQLLDASKSVP